MIKINDFKEKGFNITWKLINIGFAGSSIFYNELEANDIIDYAISIMNEPNNSSFVYELACEYSYNISGIENLIKLLIKQENTDENIEFRKWRVIYVLKQLEQKYDNYIDGLAALGDIWSKFDWPKDMLHIIQGRNNDITPQEYYTKKNYEKLYTKHLEWVEKEICYIKNYQ